MKVHSPQNMGILWREPSNSVLWSTGSWPSKRNWEQKYNSTESSEKSQGSNLI